MSYLQKTRFMEMCRYFRRLSQVVSGWICLRCDMVCDTESVRSWATRTRALVAVVSSQEPLRGALDGRFGGGLFVFLSDRHERATATVAVSSVRRRARPDDAGAHLAVIVTAAVS